MKNSSPTYIPITWMALLFFMASFAICYAQNSSKFIMEGNQLYDNKQYKEAEEQYQQALKKDKNSYKATFNLGDTYYKQGKYEDAAKEFQELTHRATSKDTLAQAYHNLGNSLLQSKKYEESINAYKNALKNNPADEDTRYNLAYAQQQLKQQQQQQNKDNKDNKNNKDKKDNKKEKDNKDKQDKNKDNKEDKENKEKQDQKKDKQKQEPDKISKEDAQRLLDALQNDEKNVQNRNKKGKQGIKVKIEKDW